MGRRGWIGLRLDVGGLDEMIADLRALEREGETRAMRALDAALADAEEVSRGLAHVSDDKRHRGDLRGSIASESSRVPGGWRGQITADSRGAHFEVERGGDHSAFIDQVEPATAASFEAAMDGFFSPLKRKRR